MAGAEDDQTRSGSSYPGGGDRSGDGLTGDRALSQRAYYARNHRCLDGPDHRRTNPSQTTQRRLMPGTGTNDLRCHRRPPKPCPGPAGPAICVGYAKCGGYLQDSLPTLIDSDNLIDKYYQPDALSEPTNSLWHVSCTISIMVKAVPRRKG